MLIGLMIFILGVAMVMLNNEPKTNYGLPIAIVGALVMIAVKFWW